MTRIAPTGAVRQREPRIRDKAHLARVAQLPCIICMVQGRRRWPVQVAHIKAGWAEDGWRAFGHSEKAHDHRTAPLCVEHHMTGQDAQHRNPFGDERAWWEHWGVYPPAFCQALVEAFAAGESGERVVRYFAANARRPTNGMA